MAADFDYEDIDQHLAEMSSAEQACALASIVLGQVGSLTLAASAQDGFDAEFESNCFAAGLPLFCDAGHRNLMLVTQRALRRIRDRERLSQRDPTESE